MIEKRSCHAAVSMGNKMFVIGGHYTSSSEVFDIFSRIFTYIQSLSKIEKNFNDFYVQPRCVSSGDSIVVFNVSKNISFNNEAKIYMYDTASNKFAIAEIIYPETFCQASCVKYYDQ